jgi:hypothetical protein
MLTAAAGSVSVDTHKHTHTLSLTHTHTHTHMHGHEHTQVHTHSGKSTFIKVLYDSLWSDFHRGESKLVPMFVSLPQLQNSAHIVDTYLESWGLLKELQGHRFVLLLDSFDEMQTPVHLCQANDGFRRWADHIIITGRTEAMPKDYLKDYFLPREKSYELLQLGVAPFSEEQVQTFIKHYVENSSKAVWKSVQAYSDKLATVPDLLQLTSTPFTLQMIVDILPELEGNNVTENFTRSELFKEYTKQAFDKENARLLTDARSGVGFAVPDFDDYCQALALTMLAGDTPNLTTTQQLPRADKAVREAAPIVKPSDNTVSFTHKSLMEYFGARAIVEFVEDRSRASALSPLQVVADRGVLRFLQDTMTPAKAKTWQDDLVRASNNRDKTGLPARAAVALTVLCALHWGLHGRSFRDVRIPGAVLKGAHLRNSDFRGADLTDVDLQDADLSGVQLQGACMTGVRTSSPSVAHRVPVNHHPTVVVA